MSFSRTINIICHMLTVFLLLSCFSTQSHAQNRLKFSTTENIAIAFYKTGGIVPNFERWIKERKPYNLTPWARRENMMKQEKSRLQLAYTQFDPADDFLLIRTFVTVSPEKHIHSTTGEETYSLPITFLSAAEALYFPYDFLGERIVVMPHKLDVIMQSSITKNQYNFIKGAVRNSAKNTMIVRLQATEADTARPHKIDGLDQWILKTKIVSLEVWSTQGTLLWEHSAPWYISPNTMKLNSLYKDK